MFQVVQRTICKHSCVCVRVFGNVCTRVTRHHDDPRRPCLSCTFIICVVTYYWLEISPPMALHCLCRLITQMNDRPAQRPKEEKSSKVVDNNKANDLDCHVSNFFIICGQYHLRNVPLNCLIEQFRKWMNSISTKSNVV